MNFAVFEETPELHSIKYVCVIGTYVHAKLTIKSVNLFKQVQVSYNSLMSLSKK